jgi:hypothetical protein
MEEFMGTPGPWEWWTSNSFLRLSSRTTGKDGGVIDSYKMSDGQTSLSVKFEDMTLIAAAPELLELVLHVRNCVKNDGIYEPANLDYFDKVIAKALGK